MKTRAARRRAPRSYTLPLQQPISDPRLEPAPAVALSSHGLAEYQRIKREYASVAKGSRGTVNVAASDKDTIPPELRRRFPLRLDILLDPAEGFHANQRTHLDLSRQQNAIK